MLRCRVVARRWQLRGHSRHRFHSLENPRRPKFVLEEKTFDLAQFTPEPGFRSPTLTYPGLELVHTEPAIYVVHDFFSRDTCERLVRKAREGLERSRADDGSVIEDRTSEVTYCRQSEAPKRPQRDRILSGQRPTQSRRHHAAPLPSCAQKVREGHLRARRTSTRPR